MITIFFIENPFSNMNSTGYIRKSIAVVVDLLMENMYSPCNELIVKSELFNNYSSEKIIFIRVNTCL